MEPLANESAFQLKCPDCRRNFSGDDARLVLDANLQRFTGRSRKDRTTVLCGCGHPIFLWFESRELLGFYSSLEFVESWSEWTKSVGELGELNMDPIEFARITFPTRKTNRFGYR